MCGIGAQLIVITTHTLHICSTTTQGPEEAVANLGHKLQRLEELVVGSLKGLQGSVEQGAITQQQELGAAIARWACERVCVCVCVRARTRM